jgi:hypothetical protein
MTENELRARVVETAREWLGTAEGSDAFQTLLKTYNAIRPLPVGYVLRETDPWCAAFVSAVGAECGLERWLYPECSCPRMLERYRAAGLFREEDGFVPRPGDLILYGWNDSGLGDYLGPPDHVGIVETVEENELTALEGNLNGAVGRRRIALNGRFIRGWCLPDYAAAAKTLTAESPAAFADVPPLAWYGEALRWAAEKGLVSGYGDGTFRPDAPITRAEAVTLLFRFAHGEAKEQL